MSKTVAVFLLAAGCVAFAPAVAEAQSAQTMYTRALDRERTLRDSAQKPALKRLRAAVASYEAIVRRYPASGYTDNALWQAANLALLAHDEYGEAADKRTGIRLLTQLRREYPSSSLVARAAEISPCASATPPRPPACRRRGADRPPSTRRRATPARRVGRPAVEPRPARRQPAEPQHTDVDSRDDPARRQAHRAPNGVRVIIELDRETSYHSERLENPRRVFFDLKGARAVGGADGRHLEVRRRHRRAKCDSGRHPGATRIVMEMEGAEGYSVFTLYEPFRLVVDFTRAAAGAPTPLPPPVRPPVPTRDASVALPPPPPVTSAAEALARAAGRSAGGTRRVGGAVGCPSGSPGDQCRREVLAGAAARARGIADRDRCRPWRPRSGRERQRR